MFARERPEVCRRTTGITKSRGVELLDQWKELLFQMSRAHSLRGGGVGRRMGLKRRRKEAEQAKGWDCILKAVKSHLQDLFAGITADLYLISRIHCMIKWSVGWRYIRQGMVTMESI